MLKLLLSMETRSNGSPKISKKCWSLRRPLHFLKTCLLKAGFWMELQPHWQLFQFQKDFTVKGYKNYWYYSFQIQIKVKNFENVRWNVKCEVFLWIVILSASLAFSKIIILSSRNLQSLLFSSEFLDLVSLPLMKSVMIILYLAESTINFT